MNPMVKTPPQNPHTPPMIACEQTVIVPDICQHWFTTTIIRTMKKVHHPAPVVTNIRFDCGDQLVILF